MTVLDHFEAIGAVRRAEGWSEPAPVVAVPALAGGPAISPLRVLLVGGDITAVLVAWGALRVATPGGPVLAWPAAVASAVAVALLALFVTGLYRSRVSSVRAVELARLPRVAGLSTAAGWLVLARFDVHLSIAAIAGVLITSSCTLVLTRSVFDAYLRQCRRRGRYCRPLLLVGDGDEADEFGDLLGRHPELGFRLAGRFDPRDGDDVVASAERAGANGVLFTASAMSEVDRSGLINRLLAAGLHVHLSAGLRGLDPRRLRVVPLAHEPLFYVEPSTFQPWQLRVKRALDIVVAGVVLVLATPVLAAAAIGIKRGDGGPVLFRQERVGRDGRPFTCLKLRTMRVGADQERDLLDNDRTGPLFKAAHDPRVTPIGRFLRQSSIDELPQLVNVLRGDMSLVGPRPALAAEVAEFDPELLRRLDVPPGMTGIWQVEARDIPDFDAYRRLDLYYVENWRFTLDLVVLVLTAQVVFSRLVGCVVDRLRGRPIDLTAPAALD